MIKMTRLTKTYGEGDSLVKALWDVTLSITAGEFVSVMGPSGSGKSTLLNIISLLDTPTSGEYLLGGAAAGELSTDQKARLRNKTFGFIFQSWNLLGDMSGLQNVCLPLKYSTTPKNQRQERGLKAMEAVGVSHLAERKPGGMSGGEQQRVAIARALVNDPEVILADEPTGNLDTKTGYDVVGALTQLSKDKGKTVIMVSHDPKMAAFADRVIYMSDGKIADDTPISGRDKGLCVHFIHERGYLS